MFVSFATVSGFVLAVTHASGFHKVLVKKTLHWCLSCRYSSNTVRRRRRVSQQVQSFLRYFRRETELRAQGLEALLTPLGRRLQSVLNAIDDFRLPLDNLIVKPRSVPNLNVILSNCYLQRPLPFWVSVPFWKVAHAVKLGEGSYGEVYLTAQIDGTSTAMKIIAVSGFHPYDNRSNITFTGVVPEMMCARYLSDLRRGNLNRTPNFPLLYNITLIRGKFPKCLMKAWWNFVMSPDGNIWLPRPDGYDEDQLFLAIEAEYCGRDICTEVEVFRNNAVACVICICQVTAALAVAESAYRFEHRDLHAGNVLVKPTDEKMFLYSIDGQEFHVHSRGYKFYIIDYTMSRINVNGQTYFVPLGGAKSQRPVESDWAVMENVYEEQERAHAGNWEQYNPRTNLLWLRHLIEYFHDLLHDLLLDHYLQNPISDLAMNDTHDAMLLFSKWRCEILRSYNSATEFLMSELVPNIPYVQFSN